MLDLTEPIANMVHCPVCNKPHQVTDRCKFDRIPDETMVHIIEDLAKILTPPKIS